MESEGEVADFISRLPDELLLNVLAHVSFKDLCRLGCVCHRLCYLTRSNVLWRRLCHIHWLDVTPTENDNSSSSTIWYKTFVECYKKWGRFLGCYSTVKGFWNRIETALKERGGVNILKSLNGPMTVQNDVASFAEDMLIPLDLMCSCHIHNGQDTRHDDDRTMGLGGLLSVYDFQSCPVLLSYRSMLNFHHFKAKAGEGHKRKILESLTILSCPLSEIAIRICLNSAGGFQRGNMFYCHRDCTSQSSFSRPREEGFFLYAESFTDWLRQLADRLEDPGTMLLPSSLSRFYREPSCVAVTDRVKVSVATAFISEMSEKPLRPGRKMFAYHITMEMDKGAPMSKTCQLQTRHWIITDGNGRSETVDGEGVIGEFPIIKPGSAFSWSSYTSFRTAPGSMAGHFGMVNLQTGGTFNVECPEFHMEALPFLELPDDSEDMGDDDT